MPLILPVDAFVACHHTNFMPSYSAPSVTITPNYFIQPPYCYFWFFYKPVPYKSCKLFKNFIIM